MCEQAYTESGACSYIKGCNEFVLLQSDRDRLAGVVKGMEEQSKRNAKELHWHNQRLIEITKERDALLKAREALSDLTGNVELYIEFYLGGDQNKELRAEAQEFLGVWLDAANNALKGERDG